MVVTAQGKQGIWKSISSDRENREFTKKYQKFVYTQGKFTVEKKRTCNLKKEKFIFAAS